MKQLFILLTAGWLLYPITNHGAETAQARLFCYSLRFHEGTLYAGALDISTIGGPPYNGELLYDSGDTWYSGLALEWSYMADGGTIYLNLPPAVDANNDGSDDFFEVSQGVSGAVTSGSYSTSTYFSGTLTATWNRTAGSKNGTCVLNLYDSYWGSIGSCSCPFELLEYAGPLTYTPGSNIVSASVNLAQTGSPANTLKGPIVFVKSSTDRFNTLTNQPGVWANAAMQQFTFYSDLILRDTTKQTNYFGYYFFEFTDGDPSTTAPDYLYWVLSIDDTNDANANGIPDFSDNPASVSPPRAPHLSLAPGSTNLLLTITGDIGHTNQVQQLPALTSTNWQATQTFVLTNSPQVISLPRPAGSPQFWRVVAW